jgi:hypothetical protein
VKFKSALVTQVSGSIGGMTGSHNQGGMYMRARSIPTNPNTAQQQAVRNAMALLATAWQNSLTADQRAAWGVYAANVPLIDRLGEARTVTGIAMYCRSNVPLIQAGLTVVDEGPVTYSLPTFSALSFGIDASDDEVDVTFDTGDEWVSEDGAAMLIYASRPQAPSINYFKGPYRYAGAIPGDSGTPPTSPAEIALPFEAAAGQKVFLKAVLTRADGRLSSPFRGSGIGA